MLGNRYSVPPAYPGKVVNVRVTQEREEIYNPAGEHLCSHWHMQ